LREGWRQRKAAIIRFVNYFKERMEMFTRLSQKEPPSTSQDDIMLLPSFGGRFQRELNWSINKQQATGPPSPFYYLGGAKQKM
jgi:hypothetical protein